MLLTRPALSQRVSRPTPWVGSFARTAHRTQGKGVIYCCWLLTEDISKGVNEQPDGGAASGRDGSGAWASQLLGETALWIFMAASLHGHNQLISGHWRLIQPLGTPPFFSLEVGGREVRIWKFPLESWDWFPWRLAPSLRASQKLPQWSQLRWSWKRSVRNNKRHLFFFFSYHLGNSKGFRRPGPGIGIKTNIHFLL